MLLHAVYEGYPSYHEIGHAFLDQRFRHEIGSYSIDHSNLSRRLIEMELSLPTES